MNLRCAFIIVLFAGCGDSAGVSPANLAGKVLTVVETGGPTNQWAFADGAGTSGMATLTGAGPFPFTYTKTGDETSRLIFDVQGKDQYDMTWTSTAAGTFMESFDGAAGNPGTFTIAP